MKISKARLQQIIKEEVEAHLQRENAAIEIDEGELKNLVSETDSEKKEKARKEEDQLFTKEPDPRTGEREKVAPKKNGIRVELKTC